MLWIYWIFWVKAEVIAREKNPMFWDVTVLAFELSFSFPSSQYDSYHYKDMSLMQYGNLFCVWKWNEVFSVNF